MVRVPGSFNKDLPSAEFSGHETIAFGNLVLPMILQRVLYGFITHLLDISSGVLYDTQVRELTTDEVQRCTACNFVRSVVILLCDLV